MIKRYKNFVLVGALMTHIGLTQAAQDFGQLFTSAKQRQTLNALRDKQTPEQKAYAAPDFQGYVLRSDGLSTLWLDHMPVQQSADKVLNNVHTK